MKHVLISLTFFFTVSSCLYSQTETKTLSYNGMYIAKTGDVPAAKVEIFTYLRFYDDGTVVLQSVSSNDPESVAKWFGRDKKFSQKGTYKIDGSNITIQVNNKESGDVRLEGPVETIFAGTINENKQLCMARDKEEKVNCFVFSKTP